MRLVSFNIQNRQGESANAMRERVRNQAAFLRSLNPDVLALQEVTPDIWNCLREEFKGGVYEFTPRDGERGQGEGLPLAALNERFRILRKESFWLSETPDRVSRLRGAAHPRLCSAIQLSGGKQSGWIFNVHLDHRSARVRSRSLEILREQILARVKPGEPRILCGDFNMPGYRKALRTFCEQTPGWEDATRFHPLGALRPTYLGWGPFRLAKARIDLCLHSSEWQVPSYHAVTPQWQGRKLSDHRAVVVELVSGSRRPESRV
ncbi:endonuclease/exonuclease/phosphatase family protein [Kiritimatiellaeota bacterium B1221]|nr:endonuclease/exonuclease/phosphatase family protein [Kiritimatiellaeota bacterium B1221]